MNPDWEALVASEVKSFAEKHALVLSVKKRQLSASFEIGCFHALVKYYEASGYSAAPRNLTPDGEYRYLTSPSGDPDNFSYIELVGLDGRFEIRQQARIKSHLDEDIAFAPDMVVLKNGAAIAKQRDPQYANGSRSFYSVSSEDVVAAHECKSLSPFPELLVSFIGLFIPAHAWYPDDAALRCDSPAASHLAPTLFVGGDCRGFHHKMILGLKRVYPINIVVGMHSGTWNLYSGNKLKKLDFSPNPKPAPAGRRRIRTQRKAAQAGRRAVENS